VLVCPTAKIVQFLKTGKALDAGLAAHLYVSVTRAEQSVAFVIDSPGSCGFPYWSPTEPLAQVKPAPEVEDF